MDKNSEIISIKAVFSGRVQGVFFRVNTKKAAGDAKVKGWVKNLSDGRVEAVFEGETADVEAVIDWCKEKQPYARVTNIEIKEIKPKGYKEFRING